MIWHTPTFLELNMNAEIGGYQSDFDNQESPVDVGVAAPRCTNLFVSVERTLAQAMVVRAPMPGRGADHVGRRIAEDGR
jgi:hypothetical protein